MLSYTIYDIIKLKLGFWTKYEVKMFVLFLQKKKVILNFGGVINK